MSKLIFAGSGQDAKSLSRQFIEGKLRRIAHGVYTRDLHEPLAHIVQKEWMAIISHTVSKGILGFRTALELKPASLATGQSIVFMISSYNRTITLPGLIIKVVRGNSQDFTQQVSIDLARSNETRMLLENLSLVRGKAFQGIQTVGHEGVERYLARLMRGRGEFAVNQLRDDAKKVGKVLGLGRESDLLTRMISEILATHQDAGTLKTTYAKALSKKEPFDEVRMNLFESFALYLHRCHLKNRPYEYQKNTFNHISFFESYFSNYIEGTKFTIDEAEDIVFKHEEINNRHADSHDVLSLYHITNNYSEISITPRSPTEFLEILQARHAILMAERPEKSPGEFKKLANAAGNTYFVIPNEVEGTLTRAFGLYQNLQPGLEKALFMHYIVSEVHPFDDGNGRMARIMMNAELVQAHCFKIIMPTAHRDNYLNGLRRATRDQHFQTYCKVLDQAQAYTATIPWDSYSDARDMLENDYADKSSDEGLPIFNRVLRNLGLSDFPPL